MLGPGCKILSKIQNLPLVNGIILALNWINTKIQGVESKGVRKLSF